MMGAGLLATLSLLAVPTLLLGMASPFAIKLAVRNVDDAGRTAGTLFALSTLGSLLGTFLPVLLITPLLGTAATFHTFGLLLSLVALPGLWPHKTRWISLLGLGVELWLLSYPVASIKPLRGGVAYEVQSFYNYIQVRAQGNRVSLCLNEGQGFHSTYNHRFEKTGSAEDLRVHSYWDYVPIVPFLYPDRKEGSVRSLAVVGLGAGTVSQLFLALYGSDCVVDGAEIDPKILEVGRRFFGLQDGTARFPHFHTTAQDGRVFVNRLQRSYDVVLIDCFRWPYVPSHLVTRECFEQVRRHLNPQGVLVVKCDRGVMGRQITATLRSVYPQVYQLVGMAVAVNHPVGDGIANLEKNVLQVHNPNVRDIMQEALATRSQRSRPFVEWKGVGQILTDDCSPTEFLVHRGLLDKLLGGQRQ
jgi:predicted membrane-bound spermidine synthase